MGMTPPFQQLLGAEARRGTFTFGKIDLNGACVACLWQGPGKEDLIARS